MLEKPLSLDELEKSAMEDYPSREMCRSSKKVPGWDAMSWVKKSNIIDH